MWQRPANNIPQLTRKGYQPHGFVWGTIFFVSHSLWVSRVEVFMALYGAFCKNCIGTTNVFMLLFDTPFPGLIQHCNWYGAIVPPIGF
jgi:hypothetical protein